MSKIVLAVIITAIVVGGGVYYWQNAQTITESDIATQPPSISSDLETYSSEKYSFNYPGSYSITLPTQSFPALTVEKERSKRLEIFQMKDFGNRVWLDIVKTPEETDRDIPKETLTVGSGDKQYDVWLYYSKDDIQIKNELKTIFDSILVK